MAKKVFVSGCYDMLHSGHVAFFEEAASHGDLYVGLGSDQTIWGLKARKPINSNAERLYMVKAIKYVKDAWINSGSGIMDFEKEVIDRLGRIETKLDNDFRALHGNGQPGLIEKTQKLESRVQTLEETVKTQKGITGKIVIGLAWLVTTAIALYNLFRR